jgi:hypothetical protein
MIKKVTIILFFLGGISACDEFTPCIPVDVEIKELYVDDECTESERATILDATERLNAMSEDLICSPIVEIVGTIEVDHEQPRPGTDVDVVVCYQSKPDWYDGSKYEDWLGCCSRYEEITAIRLFTFKTPPVYAMALAMHELMHYVGVQEHSDNRNSVMYSDILPDNTQYNSSDQELFLDVYLSE